MNMNIDFSYFRIFRIKIKTNSHILTWPSQIGIHLIKAIKIWNWKHGRFY